MPYLVSPAEPKERTSLKPGLVSSPECEARGCDVLAFTRVGSLGFQIKQAPHDLVQSIEDGRLSRELPLMRDNLAVRVLILEGRLRWEGGRLSSGRFGRPYKLTREQIRSILRACSLFFGVVVEYAEDSSDTWSIVDEYVAYLSKPKHPSLFKRPSMNTLWGIPSKKEQDLWMLQGFKGVGVQLAENIIDHFGRVPLKWDCSMDELMNVSKIGPVRAKALWSALDEKKG